MNSSLGEKEQIERGEENGAMWERGCGENERIWEVGMAMDGRHLGSLDMSILLSFWLLG